MTKAIRNDNKGRLPKSDDPRYSFEVPEHIVTRTINPKTGFVSETGIEEYFIEDNVPPARSDTLSYNYHSTRVGNHN
jgi:membrane carboxypeptidase/penicillin-binding protein